MFANTELKGCVQRVRECSFLCFVPSQLEHLSVGSLDNRESYRQRGFRIHVAVVGHPWSFLWVLLLLGVSNSEYSDAGLGIGMLAGPSEGCSECWLVLAEGFGTLIGS